MTKKKQPLSQPRKTCWAVVSKDGIIQRFPFERFDSLGASSENERNKRAKEAAEQALRYWNNTPKFQGVRLEVKEV